MKRLLCALIASSLISSPAYAAFITFDLSAPADEPGPVTRSSNGLDLIFSNIIGLNGSSINFRTALGGLAFSDSSSIGALDLTFSQDIRFISYAVSNSEDDGTGAFFRLEQGLNSFDNPTDMTGTFSFPGAVFAGNSGIRLNTGDRIEGRTSEFEAWAISSITVDTVNGAIPEPATWAFMIFGFGAISGAMRRQRKANVKVSYA